ncbi:MAG: fibronectin type III domain-containing protein [bacterium]
MSIAVLLLGVIFWDFIGAGNAGAFLGQQGDRKEFQEEEDVPQGKYRYLMDIQERKRVQGGVALTTGRRMRNQNLHKLTNMIGSDWRVISVNHVTGAPRQVIRDDTDEPAASGLWRRLFKSPEDLVDDARQFVQENADIFQLGDSAIQFVRTTESAGAWCVDFQQEYQGVLVYGSRISFRFDNSYQLIGFGVDTFPGIALEVTPSIDETKAWEATAQHLGIPSGYGYKTRLVILPALLEDDLQYFLAWMVDVEGVWRYFVDALNGHLISRYDLTRPAVSGRIQGYIFPQFPDLKTRELKPLMDQHVYLLNKSEKVYEALFDGNRPQGWMPEGLWEYGQPKPVDPLTIIGHGGPPDPNSGHTGANVYGYNLSGDYTNLMRPAYLTTPQIGFDFAINNSITAINSKSRLILLFWRWLGVYKEYTENEATGARTYYDRASIEISSNGGSTWDTAWSNGSGQVEDAVYREGAWHGGWNLQAYDISPYIGDSNQVIIRWGMGATDNSGVFCGWNIDDMEVLRAQEDRTDSNGYFSFDPTWDPNATMTIMAKLAGRYVEVSSEDEKDALYLLENITDPYDNPNINANLSTYDEVNVYYHINRMLQYIKQVDPEFDGMDRDGQKGPVRVITRWGDYYTNAFWTSDNRIYFGEGDGKIDGYRNFALYADIIYHEYTHAITESYYSYFMPMLPDVSERPATSTDTTTDQQRVLTTELDAMHEAFSDYWAAVLTDDPKLGNGGFWIGHDYVRRLDKDENYPRVYKYPDDYGDDAYANSLILSTAMWDVRKALEETGDEKDADKLFHFARDFGPTTFSDYLQAIIEQDKNRFKSTHSSLIKRLFGAHGISKAPRIPENPVGTAGDKSVHLTWVAPNDPDIVGYHVYYRTENDIETSREDPSVQIDVKNVTSFTVEGLTNETTYVLKVKSYNEYGTESESSDYVYATPYDPATKYRALSSGSNDSNVGLCFIGAIR